MKAVPESFEDMPIEHLMCRSLTHPWDLDVEEAKRLGIPAVQLGRQGRRQVWKVLLICQRCGAQRPDVWNINATELLGRSYRHPKGYLVQNLKRDWGGRRTFNNNVRLAMFQGLEKGARRPHLKLVREAHNG